MPRCPQSKGTYFSALKLVYFRVPLCVNVGPGGDSVIGGEATLVSVPTTEIDSFVWSVGDQQSLQTEDKDKEERESVCVRKRERPRHFGHR